MSAVVLIHEVRKYIWYMCSLLEVITWANLLSFNKVACLYKPRTLGCNQMHLPTYLPTLGGKAGPTMSN